MLVECEVLRFNQLKEDFEISKDAVAVEEIINLYTNGNLYIIFHCTPSQIKELVIGHLLTEGVIEEVKDILEMTFSGKNIHVKLPEDKSLNAALGKPRLITTFCSGGGDLPLRISKAAQKLRFNKIKFNAEVIFKAVEILNSKASTFRASGGTHAAALIDEKSKIAAFAEDIGRHNAIDKIIGEAAIKGVDFSRLLLASTGRLTSEIVVKAIQIGIPVLVSLSAPTSIGVRLAGAFGLTLIGFARGKRFNIYTSPDRIEK
ncbi:formate dehydrogenase accessory sulfurtransferase FdhD [Candidatus Bathyarchaeota archaeon]|nr:formate dehydrogenase accessory sulfurtransferase FdhD [Candidatus Bathyarchaeota archaeon]